MYNPQPAQQAEPAPSVRRTREAETRTLSFEENVAAADKKWAEKAVVQAPPTGRSRRPQTQRNSADNLLDLMRPIEESIERRNAPDTERASQHTPSAQEAAPINPRTLNAMNRHLGRPEEEDDEEDSDSEAEKGKRTTGQEDSPTYRHIFHPLQVGNHGRQTERVFGAFFRCTI